MPEQLQDSGLRVVRSPGATEVVLAALPPVYAHGLSAVIEAGGLRSTVVPDPAQLAVELSRPVPLVVVLSWGQSAGTLPSPPGTARHAWVVLLDAASPSACAEALGAGVTGVLTPDDTPEEVLVVLRGAAQGRTALPRELVRALCRPARPAGPGLTPTERAWLRRLAAGGTVTGLARSCDYSEREMYRRLSTVYLRLGARTRTEALLLAERSGLLDDSG